MHLLADHIFRRLIPRLALFLAFILTGISATLSAQCLADGGTLSLEDGSNINIICAGDGISDAFTPIVTGASGENFSWVITSAGGNILAVPPGPPFDLEGAGAGACFIWYIAYDDGFTGNIATGANICEYTEDNGCFDISNHITVNRQTGEDCNSLTCDALSSEIAFADGTTFSTICVDGTPDPLEIVMSGEFSGQNTSFIITNIIGEILGIPAGVGPFDLDGAGVGTCVIWYLAYDDGLEGLVVGQNADNLIGCFDLSNGAVVQRNQALAGAIQLSTGGTTSSICVDGVADPLAVVMSGPTAGDNSTFFITNANTGEILGVPGNNGPFDLDGAGEGVCSIWHLSSFGDVTGLTVGNNMTDIAGCFDISNAIVVTRNAGDDCGGNVVANGGAISLDDGTSAATICVDGVSDPLNVIRDGNGTGENRTFIITDAVTGTILGIPGNNGPFDLDGAGGGVCEIWYLAYNGDLVGLATQNNLSDLMGDFDLSNAITVTRNDASAGAISLDGGATEATICADGTPDPLTVIMSGDAAGDNSTFFITNANTGEILGVPGNNGPFDLDGAGEGVCSIWYLSSFGDVTGLAVGNNMTDIAGCFDISNPIVVTRNVGDDCGSGFNFTDVVISEVASDGRIELFNGTNGAIDVSDYWLCNRPVYQRIGDIAIECGDLLIQPGEVMVISGFNGFDAADAELGLYTTNSFSSSSALASYLEWGSSGHGRASVAIAAGIWEADFFLNAPTAGQSLQFGTNSDDAIEWTTADESLCNVNSATTATDNGGESASLRVFPNPIQGDMLNIEVEGMTGEIIQIQVFNMNGMELMSMLMSVSNSSSQIHLPESPAGTYFVRVVNNGQVVTKRFSRF
jgi:hypothetical protein